MIAYAGNDHAVTFSGAQTLSLTTGVRVYLTGAAVVTFRVQTVAGVDVAGASWPLTMTYISGSQGDFIGVLPDAVALVAGTAYRFVATVDAGANQYGTWTIPLPVLARD